MKKAKSILRYRCCFSHGAFLRDHPSDGAAKIGEIDPGHVVVATGRVHTDAVTHAHAPGHRHGHGHGQGKGPAHNQAHGMTFIQVEVSEEHPQGGWVPLMSKHGHTVMEPCVE